MRRNTYLIVGLGSIGKRHLECLRRIEPESRIIVWRQFHKDALVPEGADYVVFDLEASLAFFPDCAIIANPASKHVQAALPLAEAGVHLLVEKPLSDSMEQVADLIAICEKNNLILMVAYVLRFNASLKAFHEYVQDKKVGRILSFRAEVGQYLPDWRPASDYRQGVSARGELGGGALLELSHELDYIRWVFGDVYSVSALMANSKVLDIDVEDIVEAILEMKSFDGGSMIGNVHLDMLQRVPTRCCRAIGEDGILEWNGIENSVRYFDGKIKQWEVLFHAKKMKRNCMFIDQLNIF